MRPALDGHFMRRYHGPLPVDPVAAPPPPKVREFLQVHYRQMVQHPVSVYASCGKLFDAASQFQDGHKAGYDAWGHTLSHVFHYLLSPRMMSLRSLQAESLLRQAQAEASRKTGAAREDEEESVVMTTAGGGATAEGKPGWLVQSPAWASPEARSIEAACVVMKQALDLQAVQV